MRRSIVLGAVAAALVSQPLLASAQSYDHRQTYYHSSRSSYERCKHAQRSSATKGTVAGALVGGASGALIGHDALGALVGAGVGAVGGHEIARRRVRC